MTYFIGGVVSGIIFAVFAYITGYGSFTRYELQQIVRLSAIWPVVWISLGACLLESISDRIIMFVAE
jgi:hypothetical protein